MSASRLHGLAVLEFVQRWQTDLGGRGFAKKSSSPGWDRPDVETAAKNQFRGIGFAILALYARMTVEIGQLRTISMRHRPVPQVPFNLFCPAGGFLAVHVVYIGERCSSGAEGEAAVPGVGLILLGRGAGR